jgi:hypothetical protein
MRQTNEGAQAYEHALNHAVEFFSKAGSLFEKRGSFYGNEESALSLFQKTWIVDKALSMKLLLWLRDCRGGAGNRSATRECLKWVANNDAAWIEANIGWIPLVGRWDDLKSLFGTPAEETAVALWKEALKNKDVLAAKWADRNDKPLKKGLALTVGDFRRMLAKIRSPHIVEHKMCTKRWNEINYEKIPSIAMARYTQAFGRNDVDRFNKYKEKLETGEATIHAAVLFPHDCVRTVKHGDAKIGDAQFEAMPNFIEDTDERVIVLSDTSGSMFINVAGSIQSMDISQGLALYCSAKIPKDNPFYKKFIGFESESKFKDWNGLSFSQAVHSRQIFDGACGSTRIDTAMDLILKTAKFFNLEQSQMPTMLLIVSDMQFHSGCNSDDTEVETCLKRWDEAGYNRPRIVYWNTAGHGGQQATVIHPNVGLVSGFSTGVLKAILGGDDFTPIAIMMRALEKYDISEPK